jgi:hypothetical protein
MKTKTHVVAYEIRVVVFKTIVVESDDYSESCVAPTPRARHVHIGQALVIHVPAQIKRCFPQWVRRLLESNRISRIVAFLSRQCRLTFHPHCVDMIFQVGLELVVVTPDHSLSTLIAQFEPIVVVENLPFEIEKQVLE